VAAAKNRKSLLDQPSVACLFTNCLVLSGSKK
jgi:hypothetical protein